MSLIKYIAIAALVLFGAVLALIGVLSVTHDTPVRSVIAEGDAGGPPSIEDPLFARSIELFTGTHLDPGNSVQVLLNGDGTYPRLWKDLESAQQTITVQMYYSQPGAVADTLAKYLIERAQHKVRVLLLLDAFGSQPLKRDWIQSLKRAGVEVRWLRPLRWYTLQKAAQRSHVRAVVVDGRVGYTGGFGLADYWLGDGHHEDQWRETNVRFEGPTVGALQAAFAAGWAEATGELLTGDMFFPKSSFADIGDVQAGLMHSFPSTGSTPAERFLALSIAGARKTPYISNSYFVPGDHLMKLLLAAAHRGVGVRGLTASKKTDVKTTWYAGRTYYEKLLEGENAHIDSPDRKSTRLNSSHRCTSYADFCLQKKNTAKAGKAAQIDECDEDARAKTQEPKRSTRRDHRCKRCESQRGYLRSAGICCPCFRGLE